MNYDAYTIFLKELDKRTNGRTKSTLFSGMSLAHVKENHEAITSGMADMGNVWPAFYPGVFRLNEMYELPFVAPTAAIAAQACYKCTTTHPEMLNEIEKTTPLLAAHTSAIANLHTTDKAGLVKTLEGLPGLLLCAGTPLIAEWFTSLGASPTFIPADDAYLALEKGVVDAGIWPWAPLRSFKLAEHVTNHTVMDLNFAINLIIANKEKWETLPQDVHDVLNEIGGLSLSALSGYTLTNGSLVDVNWMKDRGDQFYTLPPDEKARWASLLDYVVGDWKEDVTNKGLTKDADKLWADLHKIVAEVSANPYPDDAWWGADAMGRYGSPNRPGGWD